MPTAVALALRALFQMAVTLGLIELADRFVLPLINKAVVEIMKFFGVEEETAKDIMANQIIQFAEEVGIGAVVLRTKIPSKIAEYLGFTTKGWNRRVLTGKTAEVAEKTTASVQPVKSTAMTLAKTSLYVSGSAILWNLLTDWVWIGNSLNFLPGDAQEDIQKRALSIKDLIDSVKSIIYSAEKDRRAISQQERALIKASADEAERQINDMQRVFSQRFILFGRSDVLNQLNNSTNALKLELNALRQMAGLIPRQPIQVEKVTARVVKVIDGDTVLLDNGETVRMVGIDAFESTTPGGEEAKKYLKNRIEGKIVEVESDPDALIDIYGRRLGVIYLNE